VTRLTAMTALSMPSVMAMLIGIAAAVPGGFLARHKVSPM
jgi:hypothetical protein